MVYICSVFQEANTTLVCVVAFKPELLLGQEQVDPGGVYFG